MKTHLNLQKQRLAKLYLLEISPGIETKKTVLCSYWFPGGLRPPSPFPHSTSVLEDQFSIRNG